MRELETGVTRPEPHGEEHPGFASWLLDSDLSTVPPLNQTSSDLMPGIHDRRSAVESRGKQGRPHLLPYFVLTFAWTWLMWGSAVAAGLSADEPPGALLYLLGVFGPLAGTTWIVRAGDSEYRQSFLRRIWNPRRVPALWWLVVVAVAGGPAALGALVAAVTGAAASLSDYSAGAVGGAIVVALIAGLAEEPGWRGAASDSWQAKTRPVLAALGIGALWSLWHLPLHFFEGSWYHGMGSAPFGSGVSTCCSSSWACSTCGWPTVRAAASLSRSWPTRASTSRPDSSRAARRATLSPSSP
jgi:membrane protease YdiL (CAAX protease family)